MRQVTQTLLLQNAAAVMYKLQLAGAKHGRVAMHTGSRHFIAYDAPQWLPPQRNQFLQEAL